jgi:hypothetical protein
VANDLSTTPLLRSIKPGSGGSIDQETDCFSSIHSSWFVENCGYRYRFLRRNSAGVADVFLIKKK